MRPVRQNRFELLRLVVASLLVWAVLPGLGCFELPRLQGVGDGELHLRAVRGDGRAASEAVASIAGAARVARADVDGALVLRALDPGDMLLRVQEDQDGDGRADRAALVTGASVRATALSTGLFTSPERHVTTQFLGDVTLVDTIDLAGTLVVDDDGDGGAPARAFDPLTERARVLVFRTLPVGPADDQRPRAFDVDGSSGVDAAGRFVVRGVLPGPATVVGLLWMRDGTEDDGTDVELMRQRRQLAAAIPTRFATVEVTSDSTDVGEVVVQLPASQGGEVVRFDVDVELNGAGLERGFGVAQFSLPGTDLVKIGGDVEAASADAAVVRLLAPVGLWNIDVDLGAAGTGTLRGAAIASATAVQGPLLVRVEGDPCAVLADDGTARDDDGDGRADRDCDRDGVLGVPLEISAYAGCVLFCGDAFASAARTSACRIAGVEFDCDDDADGQPDVTEPFSCIGAGTGTDWDGDGSCEPFDPFPGCASDDADACDAGVTPPRPSVRAEYL